MILLYSLRGSYDPCAWIGRTIDVGGSAWGANCETGHAAGFLLRKGGMLRGIIVFWNLLKIIENPEGKTLIYDKEL